MSIDKVLKTLDKAIEPIPTQSQLGVLSAAIRDCFHELAQSAVIESDTSKKTSSKVRSKTAAKSEKEETTAS